MTYNLTLWLLPVGIGSTNSARIIITNYWEMICKKVLLLKMRNILIFVLICSV